MPDKHAQHKSKYTLDRMIPGAFEGETVTRRRFMTVSSQARAGSPPPPSCCPRSASRSGRSSKARRSPWEDVGIRSTDFPDNNYIPVVVTRRPGIGEAGKTTAYMRERNPAIDTDPYDRDTPYIAISTRCAHLGCPVRWVDAAERFICPCHGGVYDLLGRRVGGPPVRPLDRFPTRVNGDRVAARRRASASTASCGASPRAIRASRSTASASTSIPRAPARSKSKLIVQPVPKLPAPPVPGVAQGAAPAPRRGQRRRAARSTAKEAGITVVDWVDERTSLSGGVRWMMFRKVPEGHQLVLHARLGDDVRVPLPGGHGRVPRHVLPPRPAGGAYESIRYITNDVFLGQFVRGMHKWGASVMVVLVFLHMGRTFFFGAYKYPRELNWVIGVVLLILTMVMCFTGYLLPFDQRAYWATIVGVNINGTGPLIGPYLSDFLRAGPEFGATTLSRFYAIHMLLVPGLMPR